MCGHGPARRLAEAMNPDDRINLRPPLRSRFGVVLLVAVLHVLAVLALIKAFASHFADQAVDAVVSTFAVTITAPPPPPATAPEPAGSAGKAGIRAVARPEYAATPKVPLAPQPAPRVASTGDANTAGATDAGSGTGAGGDGRGTGSGTGGAGQGGGLSRKAEKIAGAIVERDYNKANRAIRLGHAVTIAIDVSAAGRPTGCRVVSASPDPEADALTCRLAVERFRFRPATDVQGNPAASTYGWRQRWFH
ncbi:MAG: hypothetical protein RLZZ84_304 [Pseudomonadota bacterium]